MEKIGIICEYNPFHNGHLHHINEIKKIYKDSIIVLVIGGYFLQRGETSILSKEDKTLIALKNNVDLVIELPVLFGTQSADTFADISIKLLNYLKINKIVFGSELNDVKKLEEIVDKQLYDSEFHEEIKSYLSSGINYPTALSKALNSDITTPNDLLGISYIKAIKTNNFDIEPISIKRTNDYHDLKSDDKVISASNIRNRLKQKEDIKNYLPSYITDSIKTIDTNKYFELLKFKIITENNLEKYLTVDEGIENKLKKEVTNSTSLEDLIFKIKSKRYTFNRINRMFTHILLGILKEDNIKEIEYIRILGFNEIGKKYLNDIKKEKEISFKLDRNSNTFKYEIRAALIYDMLTNSNTYEFEQKNKPIQFE